MGRRWLARILAAGVALLVMGSLPGYAGLRQSPSAELRVAAAADLRKAFTEVAAAYRKETGQPVTLVFGASGQLVQQIENGAPYDVFAAANEAYVIALERQRLIVPGTRQLYARGQIVLWTRKGGLPCPRTLGALTAPRYAKIAIANPQHAPYGVAAREAMQAAGVWETLHPRLVFGENIEQTLQFGQSGNADVAIVALSLALGSGGNYVLIPEKLHKPLRQALAVLTSSTQPAAARRFTAFVTGREGQAILRKYGLTPAGT